MVKKINLRGPVVDDMSKNFYDYYGMDCISPKSFISELEGENDIELIVNSPGGSVFEASEIYTALKSFEGKVTAKIVGLAASAASWIVMAADTIEISPTALMMIHNSHSETWGDHRDMSSAKNKLEEVDMAIRNAYMGKTGLKEDELEELMNAETWFSATSAKEKGLVDEIMFNVDEMISPNEIFNSFSPNQEAILNFYKNPKTEENKGDVNMGEENKKTNQESNTLENTLNLKEITIENLKEENGELFNKIYNLGVEAERNRIQAIENLEIPGAEELVNKAKFETGEEAEKVAMNIVKMQKEQGASFLKNFVEDKENIGVDTSVEEDKKTENEEFLEAIVNAANKGVK